MNVKMNKICWLSTRAVPHAIRRHLTFDHVIHINLADLFSPSLRVFLQTMSRMQFLLQACVINSNMKLIAFKKTVYLTELYCGFNSIDRGLFKINYHSEVQHQAAFVYSPPSSSSISQPLDVSEWKLPFVDYRIAKSPCIGRKKTLQTVNQVSWRLIVDIFTKQPDEWAIDLINKGEATRTVSDVPSSHSSHGHYLTT